MQENINNWSEVSLESLITLGNKLMEILPGILGALLLILLGWLIAKGTSKLITRILKAMKFDNLADKINKQEWMKDSSLKIVPSEIIGKFTYWLVLILFFITASDTLGWDAVSKSFNDLINYLPQLFSAILIFVLGFYLSQVVKDFIKTTLTGLQISSAKALSSIAFYVIMIIVVTTAMEQMGVDTTLLVSNITLVLGSVFLTIAISFAIASRGIFRNILSSYYSRENIQIGQKIKYNDKTGVITKIDKIHVTVQGEKNSWLIPTSVLVEKEIELLNN